MGREGLMGKAFQKFSLISIISTDQETKASISLDAKNTYPNYTFGIQGNNHRWVCWLSKTTTEIISGQNLFINWLPQALTLIMEDLVVLSIP